MKFFNALVAVLSLVSLNAAAFAQEDANPWSVNVAGSQQNLTIEGVDCTFCYCPAGTFRMGNIMEKSYPVQLTQGFWCLDAPVTQKLWTAVMGSNPSWFAKDNGGSEPVKDLASTDNLPVECVSWSNCQDFVKTLNQKNIAPEGWRFAVPTEAQWEYACRAGTLGAFNCVGDPQAFCWFVDDSDFRPHDVKTKEANAWHIYDMLGNVLEWCQDFYEKTPNESGARLTDPTGPESGDTHVLRGGGWNSSSTSCHSYWRSMDSEDFATFDVGFRVILEPSAK